MLTLVKLTDRTFHLIMRLKKASEYDQEIPLSHTANQPMAP